MKKFKKIRKILAVIIFLLGVLLMIDILIPGTLARFKNLPVINGLAGQGEAWLKTGNQNVKNILGTAITKGQFNDQQLADQVDSISCQILESETGQRVKHQVDQLVGEAVSDVKQLPKEQVKRIKKELKRQICEDWMKEY